MEVNQMHFTLFSRTENLAESKELLNKIISKFPAGEIIDWGGEAYWKIEGVFESCAELKVRISEQECKDILKKICDIWTRYEHLSKEFLASETVEGGCTFFDKRIVMVIVRLGEI